MITIQKIDIADCDRSTDDQGNYTSRAYNFVVCEDNDIGWLRGIEQISYCCEDYTMPSLIEMFR